VSFKITGLDELQRMMSEVAKAAESLDGEIGTVSFNPRDPASVEAAVAQMEQAIDAKLGSFMGNEVVEGIATDLKNRYQQEIYDRAAAARLETEIGQMNLDNIDPTILRQIENVVTDLQSAEYNTFDRHIKKLARLLHSPELEPVTSKLIGGLDIDAWINAGMETQGSMVGSAKLSWPLEPEKELGTIILLIDRFAERGPDDALNFAHTFYYSGSSFSANVHNLTRQVLVPFARDYINYVKTTTGTKEATILPISTAPAARKIFVVHGHDEGAREMVARFCERLGFEAIVLHEQANQGRTIIEKIEVHSDVGFAVVLLTPDDTGARKGEPLRDRARQNVLWELGYFVGRLGRSRVCAFKRGDLEIPSDFGGVVFVPFDDNGGWKDALGRELQAAGFEIDWNLVMRPSKS
jgi:hypothetical protein